MLDDFSSSFIKHFKKIGLVVYVALLELVLHILLGSTATTRIENLNAWLRRQVMLRGQTKQVSQIDLSAAFVIARSRNRAGVHRAKSGLVGKKKRKIRADKKVIHTKTKRSKRRGGGAYRAYISARCKGVMKAGFKALSRDFAILDAKDKEYYKQLGRKGTLTHRTGNNSFGLQPRAAARALANASVHTKAQRCLGYLAEPSIEHLAVVPLQSLEGELTNAKTNLALFGMVNTARR